jgi:UDP-N-acetyl-D-mannosaminuronate dehydrogenase
MQPSVVIIGAGYVGLPLAIRFAQKKRPVCALDIDSDKVAALNQCRIYINK